MLIVYDWIKEYIGDKTPSVKEIENLLTVHSFEIEGIEKVGGHDVFDIDVLPNRASDCLSHRGMAREIATLINTKLVQDPLQGSVDLPKTSKISVDISDTKACRRFGTALITGLTITESPDWLKDRLAAIGQKSTNNVVDATNYIMFGLGQPLHAYDAKKFPQTDGVWKFGVRFARSEEKITVLTGEEYELDSGMQLIVDASNNISAGIAGIKGGKYAEIDESTTSILLEAANFDPIITRKTAQKLRLQTDASKRFENEPSLDLIPHALREVVALILETGGGTCEGYTDEYPGVHTNTKVETSLVRINGLLGLSLTREEVQPILFRLGFEVEVTQDGFLVTAPFERMDIHIEEDVIEEIGRVYGYSHVESVVPETVPLAELNSRQYYSEKIRGVLIKEGFSEVITSSFRKKDIIRLQNALASDKRYVRSVLRKNLTEVLDKNIQHVDLLGIDDIRAFEIGTVFDKGDGKIGEHISLALCVRKKQQGYVPKDDVILEEVVKKIESELGVAVAYDIEKGVLEINLTELLETLPTPTRYEPVSVGEEIMYKPFSVYPHMSRDIALWVSDAPRVSNHLGEGLNDTTEKHIKENIIKVLNTAAGDLRVRTTLFDEFSKDGRTSYAFRLVFQSYKKTLTDEEVNTIMDSVYAAVTKQGWETR